VVRLTFTAVQKVVQEEVLHNSKHTRKSHCGIQTFLLVVSIS